MLPAQATQPTSGYGNFEPATILSLPFELIYYILSFFHNDFKSLSVASLVSRDWRAIALTIPVNYFLLLDANSDAFGCIKFRDLIDTYSFEKDFQGFIPPCPVEHSHKLVRFFLEKLQLQHSIGKFHSVKCSMEELTGKCAWQFWSIYAQQSLVSTVSDAGSVNLIGIHASREEPFPLINTRLGLLKIVHLAEDTFLLIFQNGDFLTYRFDTTQEDKVEFRFHGSFNLFADAMSRSLKRKKLEQKIERVFGV